MTKVMNTKREGIEFALECCTKEIYKLKKFTISESNASQIAGILSVKRQLETELDKLGG